MERLPGDVSGGNSAIVPATGSMMPANAGAPVPNAAEVNPTPMTVDEGFFYQPVQAYFQFVQNNLTYMNEGKLVHSDVKPRKDTHRSWNKRSNNCTRSLSKYALVNLRNSVQKPKTDMNK